jgi:hypothetical protein
MQELAERILALDVNTFKKFNRLTGKDALAFHLFQQIVFLGFGVLTAIFTRHTVWLGMVGIDVIFAFRDRKQYRKEIDHYARNAGPGDIYIFPRAFMPGGLFILKMHVVFVLIVSSGVVVWGPDNQREIFGGIFAVLYFFGEMWVDATQMWYSKGMNSSLWSRAKAKIREKSTRRISRLAPIGV